MGERILVCGGRDFDDYAALAEALDVMRPSVVIHGAARGADSLAHRWAQNRCVPVESYPADWRTHGKAAGPIRNRRMLDEGKPDIVAAFPGGRGTEHMISIAMKAGIPVMIMKDRPHDR